ncbi:hypothetical protein JHK87_018618 [Glycine soja]|nr:hypothetical protein JHK87_018618 [Glycine soja]
MVMKILSIAKKSLAMDDSERNSNASIHASDDRDFSWDVGTNHQRQESNGARLMSATLSVISRLAEEFEQRSQVFGDDAKFLVEVKSGQVEASLNPNREVKFEQVESSCEGIWIYLVSPTLGAAAGDRGASHVELHWPARLNIVRGIVQGMHYLYTVLGSSDLPHEYLKSSNVLLGLDNEPILVDYGFSHMVNPSTIAQTLFAYKAPEAAQQGQVSRSCTIYCLGVVIIEILTGRFPSQYLSNGKGGADVVQWVETAISEGRESEVLDLEIAGSRNWLGEKE